MKFSAEDKIEQVQKISSLIILPITFTYQWMYNPFYDTITCRIFHTTPLTVDIHSTLIRDKGLHNYRCLCRHSCFRATHASVGFMFPSMTGNLGDSTAATPKSAANVFQSVASWIFWDGIFSTYKIPRVTQRYYTPYRHNNGSKIR